MRVDRGNLQQVVAIAKPVDRAEFVKRRQLQRNYCSDELGDVCVVCEFAVLTAEPNV